MIAVFGFVTDRGLYGIFGLMALLSSGMYLMNSGGIRFGEVSRDRKDRKADEAQRKRRQEENDKYLDEVAARAREREEQERLRKLLQ